AKQGDRRVIFVITGLETARARAEESERLVNWSFRQFAERVVAPAGHRIAEAQVHMGDDRRVGLTIEEDMRILVPVVGDADISAHVQYESPVQAPIAAGDEIGELVITVNGFEPVRQPLIASETIGVGGFVPRVRTAAEAIQRRLLSSEDAAAGPSS
ncbi:MAG: D-alanyl-D-alanine carboxypeptidase, partial [Pseudomonadota bacterium]